MIATTSLTSFYQYMSEWEQRGKECRWYFRNGIYYLCNSVQIEKAKKCFIK